MIKEARISLILLFSMTPTENIVFVWLLASKEKKSKTKGIDSIANIYQKYIAFCEHIKSQSKAISKWMKPLPFPIRLFFVFLCFLPLSSKKGKLEKRKVKYKTINYQWLSLAFCQSVLSFLTSFLFRAKTIWDVKRYLIWPQM